MAGIIEFPGPQHLLPANNNQQLVIGQAQYLVRGEQPAAAEPFGIAVLWDDLGHGNALPGGHGGVHLHGHVAAAAAGILRRDIICAAKHELRIRIAHQFRPEIVGIPVLELGQGLAGHEDLQGPGPNSTEPSAKIRYDADVVHLVQYDIHRYFTSLIRRAVSIPDQLDEQEGKEKGRQKFQ